MQIPSGDLNNRSVIGERYDLVGQSAIRLRDEQRILRDELLNKRNSLQWAFEEVRCLCGEESSNKDVTLATVDRYGLPNRVEICMNCGLVRTNPRMNDDAYANFYQNFYRKLYSKIEGGAQNVFDAYAAWKGPALVGWLKHFVDLSGKNVIEIGAGGGWNLMAIKEIGGNITGYDYDRAYLGVGRDQGITLYEGGIQEALVSGQKFELVILSHVIEHFLCPKKELLDLRKLLTLNGLIYIETPGLLDIHNNRSDPLLELQIAHTFYFTLTTLGELMYQCGFRMVVGDESICSLWQVNELPDNAWKASPVFARFLIDYLKRCEIMRDITKEEVNHKRSKYGLQWVKGQLKGLMNRVRGSLSSFYVVLPMTHIVFIRSL